MRHFPEKRIFALLCLNIGLYVPIVILDINKATAGITKSQGLFLDIFKYAAIISCFLICVFAFNHAHRRAYLPPSAQNENLFYIRASRYQIIIFAFTLAADFFIIFTPFFKTGILLFLGAHFTAIVRYRQMWAPYAGAGAVALFIFVFLIGQRQLHINNSTALLLALSLVYTALILTALVSTIFAKQPPLNSWLSRIGMLLFAACDINVAVYNISEGGQLTHGLALVLMWLFYLPSQTILALSACRLCYNKAQ